MITASSTIVDVAFAVCTALERAKIIAVLTGGSAATYYAPEAYQSRDLDFVITLRGGARGAQALAQLGYQPSGDHYVHPLSPLPLEFPPGPLGVGEDLITSWSTIRRKGEVLHVLTPFDSCRDRLASYLFWNDLSGLEQALAVHRARVGDIDLARLRDWCARERQSKKFELYEARFTNRAAAR